MDLYGLLGLSRDASPAAIERAYRRLARRYHPGVNPGDRVAAERFRQVQQAYEILGHAERRRDYDRGARRTVPPSVEATVAFAGFDFSAPAEGAVAATFSEIFADVFRQAAHQATSPDRGASIEIPLRLSFEHAMRGGAFPVSVTRHDRCPTCAGDGRLARVPVACPACRGEGSRRWARGHMVFTAVCEACEGAGHLVTEPCTGCGGRGVALRSEVVTIHVPPGVESGAHLVVPGRGHVGGPGGVAGDVIAVVEVAPHAVFRREGADLHLTLPVAVHEAALGARIDVPTLEGAVKLRVPPGTASGQRLRVRGRGVAGNGEPGDLIAEIQIVLPPVRDERSRELLREFGRLNDVDVRAHLFGRDV